MMYQRPLHLKELFDAVALAERVAFAERPTERVEAVRLPARPNDTEPIEVLPLDEWCRPYLVSVAKWGSKGLLWDDTICETARLVEEYHRRSRAYPKEIILCASRYFVRRHGRFYPMDMAARPIPFRYEDSEAKYEILVRGVV